MSGLLFSFLTFYVFGFGLGRTTADILGWFPHGILSVTFVKLPVDWQPAALFCTQNKIRWLTRTSSCRRCSSNCHLIQKALLYLLRKIHTPSITFQHCRLNQCSEFGKATSNVNISVAGKCSWCSKNRRVILQRACRTYHSDAYGLSGQLEFVFPSTGQHSRIRMQFRFKLSIVKGASFKFYIYR